MPAPIESFTMITTPTIQFALEPAQNAFYSLALLIKAKSTSGFGDWVRETIEQMSSEEWRDHMVAINGLAYAVMPTRSYSSFSAFVDDLAAADPVALRDQMLDLYARLVPMEDKCVLMADVPEYDKDAVLADFNAYLSFLRTRFDEDHIITDIERTAYEYAINPPAMQEFLVNHLRHMWNRYMVSEWERVKPMLKDAVRAFSQVDLREMSKLEAAQFITDQAPDPCLNEYIENAETLIFIPNAHIGPYVSKFHYADGKLGIIFGARLPKGVVMEGSDLSRNEILVRLSALADDSRLRILEYIAKNGEQRSQDIMNALDLSQSAASRHLKQLSATGYLIERRCEGAKCYQLNPGRLEEILGAVKNFLMSEESQVYNNTAKRMKVHA